MDFDNSKAIYLQIADYISHKILTGDWKEDEKIPSVRELAITLEVNPNTAMRAYEYLQTQQLIYTKRGMGYFVQNTALNDLTKQRKAHFLNEEMPQFFSKMQLLGITIEEINHQFEAFKKH
jgi:GntR family transcriptional regulator